MFNIRILFLFQTIICLEPTHAATEAWVRNVWWSVSWCSLLVPPVVRCRAARQPAAVVRGQVQGSQTTTVYVSQPTSNAGPPHAQGAGCTAGDVPTVNSIGAQQTTTSSPARALSCAWKDSLISMNNSWRTITRQNTAFQDAVQ